MDIKNLFKIAAEKKASDLHLLVGQPPIIRIDGNLVTVNSVWSGKEFYSPLSANDLTIAVELLLNKEQRIRLNKDKDIDCSYDISGVRFRVNISYEKNNLCVVARVIEEKKPTLEE